MDKKILKFVGTKIEKYKFHQNKSLTLINDIDNKIVVSNKVPFREQDFRYFTGYRDSEKIKPLCIFHPQMITYKRNFDENRQICFFIEKEKFLIKYMKILEKARNIIKINCNRELIYNEKYLETEKINKSTQKVIFSVYMHQ